MIFEKIKSTAIEITQGIFPLTMHWNKRYSENEFIIPIFIVNQCSSLRTQIYNSIETAQGFACQYVHLVHMRSTSHLKDEWNHSNGKFVHSNTSCLCRCGIKFMRRFRKEGCETKKVKSNVWIMNSIAGTVDGNCHETIIQSKRYISPVAPELERSDSWLCKSWHGWHSRPLPISISPSSKTKKCIDDHFFIQLKLATNQNGTPFLPFRMLPPLFSLYRYPLAIYAVDLTVNV